MPARWCVPSTCNNRFPRERAQHFQEGKSFFLTRSPVPAPPTILRNRVFYISTFVAWVGAPLRTHNPYPQPPLVHGCALAYCRGKLTDYAHAWTGKNYLPQAPQSSALPSCATARYPISTGQENVTGPSSLLTFGHNPSKAPTQTHAPTPTDSGSTSSGRWSTEMLVTQTAPESTRWSRSNLGYRRRG